MNPRRGLSSSACIRLALTLGAMLGALRGGVPLSAATPKALLDEPIFPLQAQHVHGSTLVVLPNGDVLAAWFQGSGERWADDVRVMGARKRRGETGWSAPFLLADVAGFPDCNPVLFLDPKGRLWLMWITILANQWESALIKYRVSEDFLDTSGAPRWNWQDTLLVKAGDKTERGIQPADRFVAAVDEQARRYAEYLAADPARRGAVERWTQHAERLRFLAGGRDMLRAGRVQAVDGSTDEAQLGYPQFRRLGWQTRNKPFITRTGRMIVPLYSDGFSFSLMAYSDDAGATWQASTPLVGAGNIQPAIAATASGELVAYMRDNGPPPKRLHVSRSTDDGVTWSDVRDSELPNSGTACDIVVLANGHWVLINNDTETGRHRLTVSLSEDGGRTWPWHKALVDDSATRSHYPAIVRGDGDELHVTYSHFATDQSKTIRYAVINEAWIRQ